ncbi:MAG: SCO1664 family protein [Candidatus Nanopelagicales bacterium]|nr:SCO1664 family protein [Candidatus Nanopelagicales bacterium]
MPEARLLAEGELTIIGRLAGSSNATLLCTVTTTDGTDLQCVYKPVAGERPLWDFPTGTLAAREVAAYELSELLGWGLIPTTVWREFGPHGEGSCQRWIDEGDFGALVDVVHPGERLQGWRLVLTGESEYGAPVSLVHADDPDLHRMSVLDVLLNNADRKAGHLLRDESGRIWGIDHGLTFNEEPKLRTVLWGWAGERVPEALLHDLRGLADRWEQVELALSGFLDGYELEALEQRLERLVSTGRLPKPDAQRPAIPWPLY